MQKQKFEKIVSIILGASILSFGLFNVHHQSGITEGGGLGLELLLDHWFHISPAYTSAVCDTAMYLTGAISPFYSLHPCGERFRHTLFLCPDCAAVTGFTAAGAASGFHYVTDAAALAQFAESFEVLISGCEPLLTVTGELPPPEGVTVRRYGNAQVWADAQSAVVSTLTDPVRSFRFLHPDMCKAFHALLSL